MDKFTGEKKETLGAMLLEFAHGQIDSSRLSQNAEQKLESRKYKEFLAEAAADTLALIPRYGLFAAGLARAAVLVKPGETLSNNLKDFALNAAEGSALKKISFMAAPDLKHSLSNAGMRLLAQGAAFGSTKALFKNDTWFDDKGAFSASRAVFQTSSAAMYAGLLNLPAGYLSGKIAGVAIDNLSKSGFGVRSSLIVSGVSAGYGSGFLLGSTNALLEGKGVSAVLSSGNDAGLLSAASGAFLMSLSPLRFSAVEKPAAKDLESITRFEAARSSKKSEPLELKYISDLPADLDAHLALQNRAGLQAAKFIDESKSFRLRTEPTRVLKENISLGSVPLSPEWLYLLAVTRKEPWSLRVYDGKGGLGAAYVKHDFAEQLDLALLARTSSPSESLAKGSAFAQHPHHIEIIEAFRKVPDPSIIKRLDIRPDTNIWTPWHRRADLNPFQELLATADMRKNSITVSLKSERANQWSLADHEWGHLLEKRAPLERSLFDISAHLESRGYYVSSYAAKNHSENWSEHSAAFLGGSKDFMQFVNYAPLRAVPLARAIGRSLENMEKQSPGSADPGLLNRLAYTNERVLPRAVSRLESQMKSTDRLEALRAVVLYGALAPDPKLGLLQNAALGNKFLRPAAYSSIVSRMESDQYRLHGYERHKVSDNKKQLSSFLAEHLKQSSRSYSRDYALQGLLNHLSDMQLSGLLAQDLTEGQKVFRQQLYWVLK